MSKVIDVSDRIGGIVYPIPSPERIKEIRRRKEAGTRDRSNGRKAPQKRKKDAKEDRLDTHV